jgi:biopolymer transport protein ExbD
MPAVASRGRGRRTINEINMVPFIDVMLVLLIIFMVTAPLITPSLIDLPSVGKANRQPDQKVIEVVIGKDEKLVLKAGDNSRPMAPDLAPAILQAQAGKPAGSTAVVISADRNVKYETVVQVMDTLQRAGVQRVGLSVQEKKELEAKRRAEEEAEDRQEAKEKAQLEARKKKEAEAKQQQQQQAEAAKKKEADAKQAAADRAATLKRMQGLAGASGNESATGTALKSSGPSGSYGGKVAAAVRPNVVFPDADLVSGNPGAEFDVRLAPDGTIVGTPRLVKSSGLPAWDQAALRALQKTERLPRDVDGRVPPALIVELKPKR